MILLVRSIMLALLCVPPFALLGASASVDVRDEISVALDDAELSGKVVVLHDGARDDDKKADVGGDPDGFVNASLRIRVVPVIDVGVESPLEAASAHARKASSTQRTRAGPSRSTPCA